MITCHRCGREFANHRALAQHARHFATAKAGGRINRICPDRRDTDEAREAAVRLISLKARMGMLGRHP